MKRQVDWRGLTDPLWRVGLLRCELWTRQVISFNYRWETGRNSEQGVNINIPLCIENTRLSTWPSFILFIQSNPPPLPPPLLGSAHLKGITKERCLLGSNGRQRRGPRERWWLPQEVVTFQSTLSSLGLTRLKQWSIQVLDIRNLLKD